MQASKSRIQRIAKQSNERGKDIEICMREWMRINGNAVEKK